MNLEEMQYDIAEREEILSRLDKSHPLYYAIESKLLERLEKYNIMARNLEKKDGKNLER